jgi:predicted O-methyltransferase YrrM
MAVRSLKTPKETRQFPTCQGSGREFKSLRPLLNDQLGDEFFYEKLTIKDGFCACAIRRCDEPGERGSRMTIFRWARRRRDEPAVVVAPLTEIPFAKVDLSKVANPVPAIIEAPEFSETRRYFAETPSSSRSLLTDFAQALLYTVIRNQQPDHVVEIGTYKGGTAETLGRALHGNRRGIVHTLSPFDAERFAANFHWWPTELKQFVQYYPINSMEFFINVDKKKLSLDLVLVDGNHDYEFASFDIQATARRLTPGGFMFIDNVAQAGPFLAATEFLAANSDWIDCGLYPLSDKCDRAFDGNRTNVPLTDFFIFRAPRGYSIGARPRGFGDLHWSSAPVNGIRVSLGERRSAGTLRAQCILRGFREDRIEEIPSEVACTIDRGGSEVDLTFDRPLSIDGEFNLYFVETWLIWAGDGPLNLSKPPTPF